MKSGADLIRFVRDPRPLAGGRASRFYLVRLTQMNQTTAPNYKWVVLSNAISTDAFPADQRGLALGLNMVAAIAGAFLGLVIGGVLAPINWHLVFLVSVPVSLFGTVWAYLKLHDNGARVPHPMFHLDLFRIRAFSAGNLASVLSGLGRGERPIAEVDRQDQ